MSYRPLEGLTVIELASVLAGPAVGMFFAELGARVIKVENRANGGDMTRSWKFGSEDSSSPISAYFSAVNYRKEYLDLDLNHASDLEQLDRLCAKSDILINNMKRESLERLGLSGKKLRSRHPRLIIAQLNGFAGESDQVAFDIVLQAETGYISMCGTENSPARLPVAFIDLFAAHQLKEAILLALIQRSQDGSGALISTSLEACALSSLANQASNYLMEGSVPIGMGTLHPNIAPYGELISTADGKQFILAVGTDKQFELLCQILDIELYQDSRFRTNQCRVENRTAMTELIEIASRPLTSEYFYEACLKAKVPLGRVRRLDEVMEDVTARSMVLEEEIEGRTSSRLSTIAFKVER